MQRPHLFKRQAGVMMMPYACPDFMATSSSLLLLMLMLLALFSLGRPASSLLTSKGVNFEGEESVSSSNQSLFLCFDPSHHGPHYCFQRLLLLSSFFFPFPGGIVRFSCEIAENSAFCPHSSSHFLEVLFAFSVKFLRIPPFFFLLCSPSSDGCQTTS
jgi:hypothetical protein